MEIKRVYLGADHAGFSLKEKIKKYLDKEKIKYSDLGGDGKKEDDYPDFAFEVGRRVVKEKSARGILICGTGTGMVVAANKILGVRAAVGYDNYSVKMGRRDNNINVLCLRGRSFSDSKNLEFIKMFLNEDFSKEMRHKRRINKISKEEGR